MTPQEQVKSLTYKIISNLCRITERPNGWLPHIVYVEEEGDYPVSDVKVCGRNISNEL